MGNGMNLFNIAFRITHLRNPYAWEETVATFTGKSEAATVRTRLGPNKADYNAYEIVYDANGKKCMDGIHFIPCRIQKLEN